MNSGYRRIAVEDLPQDFIEGEKNFIYLIGDPKQAIYSFRGADVFTYLAARGELMTRNATVIPLSANFRSTEKLIAAVNLILQQKATLRSLPRYPL